MDLSFAKNKPPFQRRSLPETRSVRLRSNEALSSGFAVPFFHDQVLRRQNCGSTWITASAGPRLAAVMVTRMSCVAARKLALRVFVEDPQVGMRGRGVEIVVPIGVRSGRVPNRFQFSFGMAAWTMP